MRSKKLVFAAGLVLSLALPSAWAQVEVPVDELPIGIYVKPDPDYAESKPSGPVLSENSRLIQVIRQNAKAKHWMLPSEAMALHTKVDFTQKDAAKLAELHSIYTQSRQKLEMGSNEALMGVDALLSENSKQLDSIQALAQRHAEFAYKFALSELVIRKEVYDILQKYRSR